MKKCIAEELGQQTASALDIGQGWTRYGAFVGLDVHKDTIAVAIALPGRDEPVYRGEIANERRKIQQWLTRVSAEFEGQLLLFCYEAGRAAMDCIDS
jgi:hypothetical protein